MTPFETLRSLKSAIERAFEYQSDMAGGDPEQEEEIEECAKSVMNSIKNEDVNLLENCKEQLYEAFEYLLKNSHGDSEQTKSIAMDYELVSNAVEAIAPYEAPSIM